MGKQGESDHIIFMFVCGLLQFVYMLMEVLRIFLYENHVLHVLHVLFLPSTQWN